MKSVKEGENEQVVLQNQPPCACADRIQDTERMFRKFKMINTRVHDLAMNVKTVEEELKKIKDSKGRRKEEESGEKTPWRGTGSKFMKTMMIMTVGLEVDHTEAAPVVHQEQPGWIL